MNYSTTKVTMELRDVLKQVDDNGKPFVLWDFDYPSYYTGADKKAFEQLVIDHYLFHQIGVETVARFKHNLKTRMREIMPYYIQRYESVALMKSIDDPFGNVDIVETYEEQSSGSSSGSTNDKAEKSETKGGESSHERRFSNTPQGSIDNIDDYMTEATKESDMASEGIDSTVKNEGSSKSTSTGSISHTLTRKGNQGVNTYAHDMIELRQSFLNVDMEVIGALRDLFLYIY